VRRSKAHLERNLYAGALHDAEKVHMISIICNHSDTVNTQATELNPSSYLGYELKHAALYNVRRYDEAIEAFNIMLSKLDNAPDPQIRSKSHTTHAST